MNAQLSVSELTDNAAQLSRSDFERFFKNLVHLRVRRSGASVLPNREAELLKKINQPFPAAKWERLKFLDWKLEFEILDENEASESLRLAEEYEEFSVNRLRFLTQLAALRNVSLDDLTNQLGIEPVYHA